MQACEDTNKVNSDISVALCTCEGSFFLPAQLESLAKQTILPGELVICDDASADDTVTIIEKFLTETSFPIRLQVNERRLGVVQNFVTGCTVLANRALTDLALPIPDGVVMHDWWLALIAATRGNILFIETPTVLYRKHRKNVIGASGYYSGENTARLLDVAGMERELADVIRQAIKLQERFKNINRTSIEELSMLDNFISNVGASGFPVVKAAIKNGALKQGLARNFIYLLLLQKGGYRRYL